MLLAFSVENFRSIRDLQTLSMEESRADPHLEWSHVMEAGKHRVLKTAAIYGPNASGKSSLLRAMSWMRNFILNSSREGQTGDPIDVTPFLLNNTTESAPSHFEIEFFWQEHDYRYGFRVDSAKVVEEWLYRKQPGCKPAKLFTRDGKSFEVSPEFFKEGKGLEERTRPNALFLSVCAQFEGPESVKILTWMRRLRSVSGLSDLQVMGFTAKRLADANHRQEILALAQQADFNIATLRSEIEELTENNAPADLPESLRKHIGKGSMLMRNDIKVSHDKLDKDGKVIGKVEFDLIRDESQGTQKFIALSGPITHTLDEGSILIVDEFEARLHPLLTQAIFDLFHGPANTTNAQLICATHDVSLLEPERFRRDQVWFCEKNKEGATELYSLAEFDPKEVRPDSKFSRRYMLGLFGAVPRLTNFQDAAAKIINHE